ncbi:MAG: 16S rRNA (uracil(1498)-N(3))-methyltransferase [Acidobacteria bacterium]|nr:16S rRNA (uracil(1498)-N(3))-methyltransferase [Acidobacteriota bacterium]
MTRRRWIADEVSGNRAALVGEQAVHLARVLRVRVGQEFEIACDGRVRLGRVATISPERVEFDLGAEVNSAALPVVHLLLAIFKFDRMEWAIEKATELGVTSILPFAAQRSEKNFCAAADKRVERWRRIAREAAQQSRRDTPPDILALVKLADAARFEADTRVALAPEGAPLLALFARSGRTSQSHIAPGVTTALAVGPEGGWTEAELRFFRDSGWTLASLGPTILRAETAAIAALAVVTQALTA